MFLGVSLDGSVEKVALMVLQLELADLIGEFGKSIITPKQDAKWLLMRHHVIKINA